MILTVTPNPAVDQTIEMDEELDSTEVQRSKGAQFDSGGNGVNVSQFVRALGNETIATGFISGFTGYFIQQDLKEYDVETDFCQLENGITRMNTTILTPQPEGPQTTRLHDKEDTRLRSYQIKQTGPEVPDEYVDELIARLKEYKPEIVNIGGSLPPEMEPEAVDRIAAAGDWETAVDLHGEVLPELEEKYEYCRPHVDELELATDIEIESINSCQEAALELQSMGFERVVASMGEEGAMLLTPEHTLYAPAMDVPVVDTSGAGDALFAGCLWAYDNGWDDDKALRAGVATAHQVITVTGPSAKDLSPQEKMDDVQVWVLNN